MKLHKFIAEINLQEKQVSDLSGEEHANLLFNILELLMSYIDDEVISNKNDFDIQKVNKARYVVHESITLILNLISNAPYSKLHDTRVISKKNLDYLEEMWTQNYIMLDRLKEFCRASERRMDDTKSALEQVNERLQ